MSLSSPYSCSLSARNYTTWIILKVSRRWTSFREYVVQILVGEVMMRTLITPSGHV